METGFFTMDDINFVCSQTCLATAKEFAISVAQRAVHAKKENIAKAMKMINSATSIKHLGLGLTNFFFAHPSEDLKVVK